jgi:hypothetical protein
MEFDRISLRDAAFFVPLVGPLKCLSQQEAQDMKAKCGYSHDMSQIIARIWIIEDKYHLE